MFTHEWIVLWESATGSRLSDASLSIDESLDFDTVLQGAGPSWSAGGRHRSCRGGRGRHLHEAMGLNLTLGSEDAALCLRT